MSARNPLPGHFQFLPAPEYAGFAPQGRALKYPTFAAMRGELAWLLGVNDDKIIEIDNSDKGDGDHDNDLALDGKVIGSFWHCPFKMPATDISITAE
jgi:hypothetical protein